MACSKCTPTATASCAARIITIPANAAILSCPAR
jgi:hypothetical protein